VTESVARPRRWFAPPRVVGVPEVGGVTVRDDERAEQPASSYRGSAEDELSDRRAVVRQVLEEMDCQDRKWGKQNQGLRTWLVVLMEEVWGGESGLPRRQGA